MGNRTHSRRAVIPAPASRTARRQQGSRIASYLGPRHQHQGRRGQQRHWGEVGQGIERRGRVEDSGRGQVAVDHEAKRVSIVGSRHQIGRDIAPSTRAVFHHHGLPQSLGQGLGQGARHQIG